MRFKLDENFGKRTLNIFQAAGHGVLTTLDEGMQGCFDRHLYDVCFQISYGPSDDRLNGFYIPALSHSVRYDRSAGYFSSTALAVAAAGVAAVQKGHALATGTEPDDLFARMTEREIHGIEDAIRREMKELLKRLTEKNEISKQ